MTLEIILGAVLGVVAIAQIIGHIVYVKTANRQILDLNKALMAKSLTEFSTAKIIEEPKEDLPEEEPEYTPIEEVDEATFHDLIRKQLDGK